METGTLLHHHRYRIRELLGQGGMGAVYLAEDLNLASRLVAVKENLNNGEEAQRQFRREAVLLAHLRHPNLPQVIDYFLQRDGRQFLVMEYVPGDNLQELIYKQGALSMDEALVCIDQIMQAVAYMHSQRDPETGQRRAVIHRDIKPANIKRTPEGRYLLVDFGIAKMYTSTMGVTAVSARSLTPGYAPIEQYGGGTDERSDVYALGATLYALLTGKTPPSSVNLGAGAPLPPLRSYNSKPSPAVAKVVERAMRLNAGERYQSVESMYEALFNRPLPTTSPHITSAGTKAIALPRNRALALGVGGAGFLAVVAIWLLLATGGGEDVRPAVSSVAAVPTIALTIIAVAPVNTPTAIAAVSVATPVAAATVPETVTAAAGNTATPVSSGSAPTTMPIEVADTPKIVIDLSALPDSTDAPTRISTSTPIPSPTRTLLPTPTITLTRTPIPTQTRTPISTPTKTPIPTPTSTSTSTRMPTPVQTTALEAATLQAPVAPGALPVSEQDGPTAATLELPSEGAASSNATKFKWSANAALAPGQAFEVLFWRQGEDALRDSRPVVGAGPQTELMLPVQNLAQGSYQWSVWLVQLEPTYERLRQLSEPRTFTVSSELGGGGGSRPGPNPPEPNPPEPPPPPN